jgi:prefoldin beta subunit
MTVSLRAFEEAKAEVQETRVKLHDLSEKRAQVFIQKKECELVLSEFDFLDDSDVVMKQVGPALVRQTLSEAKENVGNRLEFIEEQIKSLEAQIEETEKAAVASEQKFMQFRLPPGK